MAPREPDRHARTESFGSRLRSVRTNAGLSQRALAMPRVTAAYISRLEADERRPSMHTIRLLAAALGVTPSYLEHGVDEPGEDLAGLVLQHEGSPLPPLASELARRILGRE